jgi:hypothetical protein
MNEQLLEPLGYRIVFDPQELAIFQEDEEQRSAAFYNYVASTLRPSIAIEILGIELPEGVTDANIDEKWEKDLELKETMATAKEESGVSNASDAMTEGNNPRQPDEKGLIAIDLEKWERKALKRIQRGNDPACSFASDHIPMVTVGAIEGALETTTNKPDLVKALFNDPFLGYP